jgi:hypothetical protein
MNCERQRVRASAQRRPEPPENRARAARSMRQLNDFDSVAPAHDPRRLRTQGAAQQRAVTTRSRRGLVSDKLRARCSLRTGGGIGYAYSAALCDYVRFGRSARLRLDGQGRHQPGDAAPSNFFVVAQERLVLDGAWGCSSRRASGPQPLFVRSTRDSRWRVLTRLPGSAPPLLAVSGTTLAVGIQRSLRRMQVLLIDARTAKVRRRFDAPDAYMTFADPDHLVLSLPSFAAFPLEQRVYVAGAEIGGNSAGGDYRLALYTTTGQRVKDLGRTAELPLASHDRLVTIDEDLTGDTETVSVRRLPDGPTSPLIGFRTPARELISAALAWPRLAIIETTSTALPDGQFTCRYGTYNPPIPPFVQTLNLDGRPAFNPPPREPPQPTPEQLIARCGGPVP